jgi:hypothetical protein
MTEPVDAPLWRYHYRLTRADVAAFEALRVQGVRPLLIAVVAAGGLAGWHYERIEPYLPFDAGGTAGQAILGIVIAGLGFLAAEAFGWLRRRRRIARYPLPEGDTVVEVFGGHIAWAADGRDDLRPWERVGNVVATPAHVFVFTAPGEALIMPLRAFESATDMAAFADWANDHIERWLDMLAGRQDAH